MKQLVLDIRPDAPPTLDNFVAGSNEALLAALRELACAPQRGMPHLYLWGPSGSGRSHLARATVSLASQLGQPALKLRAAEFKSAPPPETPGLLLAVDDIDQLDDEAQILLFDIYNRAAPLRQRLLLTGSAAPRALQLREDLRTRIGQCLGFEVQPLDDAARAAILATLAERRGLRLADEVIEFLLRHGRRDLPSLVAVLERLDVASLEHKRPVTLPLLREMLQSGLKI